LKLLQPMSLTCIAKSIADSQSLLPPSLLHHIFSLNPWNEFASKEALAEELGSGETTSYMYVW